MNYAIKALERLEQQLVEFGVSRRLPMKITKATAAERDHGLKTLRDHLTLTKRGNRGEPGVPWGDEQPASTLARPPYSPWGEHATRVVRANGQPHLVLHRGVKSPGEGGAALRSSSDSGQIWTSTSRKIARKFTGEGYDDPVQRGIHLKRSRLGTYLVPVADVPKLGLQANPLFVGAEREVVGNLGKYLVRVRRPGSKISAYPRVGG